MRSSVAHDDDGRAGLDHSRRRQLRKLRHANLVRISFLPLPHCRFSESRIQRTAWCLRFLSDEIPFYSFRRLRVSYRTSACVRY